MEIRDRIRGRAIMPAAAFQAAPWRTLQTVVKK
jgi:hypothetical protein